MAMPAATTVAPSRVITTMWDATRSGAPYAEGSSSAATATSPSMWSGRPEKEQPSKSGPQNRPERPTGTALGGLFHKRTGGEKTSEPRSNRFTEQEMEIARGTDLPTCWRLSATP